MRLAAGERVGDWELLAQLARGGQGAVFRARHARTGAAAALKVLLDATPASARRFAQEARVLRRAAHPNVVRVLDHGERPGAAWLALELVEGEDLLAIARRGPPPFDWTARVLAGVALALEHCHALGVVHRDVKPGNVLVERGSDRPVLVDFGLVKRDPAQLHLESLDAQGPLSTSESIKGTPEYMAPEQVSPKAGEVGRATDVYGLGATLFHLLTGEAPFGKGPAVIVMRQVTRTPPRDPRAVNPAVTAALAELCLSCLAKDPAARPPSAVAVAAALMKSAGRAIERQADSAAETDSYAAVLPPADEPPPPEPIERRPLSPILPGRLPLAGETFGGCQVLRLLGQGAFGAVFEGRRADGSSCAIKVLRAAHSDSDARSRFSREVAAGLAVEHPGVVRVLEHGEERGFPFLLMELVPGARPLDRWAQDARPPVAERLRVFLEVVEGVQAAHERGLVHRDLKPQNVLVDQDGHARVVDLGLARHLDKERMTLSGVFVGTVAYMAPEQVMGRGAHADARTDVWALGVILYELLAGERPFEGDSAVELMAAILEDRPRDPARALADAPRGLGDVALRALAKAPDERFQSAAALGDALRAVMEGFAPRRGPPRLLIPVLVVVAALVLGAGAWLVQRQRARAARAQLELVAIGAADLLRADRPLVDDAGPIRLLESRLETWSAAHGAPEGDLAVLADQVRALTGLLAVAEGAPEQARAAAGDLSRAQDPALLALRGALQDDPGRAVADLSRAIDDGRVLRVDLLAWRAAARARRGPTAADAPLVLGDLGRVAQVRPLSPDEVGWQARALLALRQVDEAAALVEGRTDLRPDVRWAVGLARAAALLDPDPDAVARALLPLPDPPPPEARALGERALRALERPGGASDARLAPLAELTAKLLGPGALSPGAVRALHERVAALREVTDALARLALALAALAPDDAAVQRAAGRLVQYMRAVASKRRHLPALRRAVARAPEGPARREDEELLCKELGLLVAMELDAGAPPLETDECLALADRLLAGELHPGARAQVLGARACARRARGDHAGALADLDEARTLATIDLHILWRARALLALGREDEALAALGTYLAEQLDGHVDADRAAALLWEVGRRRERLDAVRAGLEHHVRVRPRDGGWWVRLAWTQRALKDEAAARHGLVRAAEGLAASTDAEVRALADRARDLAGLDDLVQELERRRGRGTSP